MEHTGNSDRTAAIARLGFFVLGAVVLTQLGGLVLSTMRDGTPVGTWLFLYPRWSEPASQLFERIADVIAIMACVFAALLPYGRLRIAAGVVASSWFALMAGAEWYDGGAPFTDWAMLAHATRIAAPLVLALWNRQQAVRWILRVAIALTFAVHGYEALQLHPQFVDFILAADRFVFGLGLNQGQAELMLRLIGAHDVLLAGLILTGRDFRPVLYWAAFWGLVTASSRVVQGGLGGLHHTLIRAANGGLPLVLLLISQRKSMETSSYRLAGRVARVALPALIAFLPFVASAQALTSAGPGHLRIVWTEDPAHKATISWSTQSAGSTHEVYLDTQPRNGTLSAYAQKVAAQQNGTYSGGSAAFHHAEVTGLQPSTTYYFVVVSDGVVSPERHFVSAHADDRPFKLISGGDSRSGLSDRKKINQMIADIAEQEPDILAFHHGGDFNQSASDWGEWDGWLEDHALTFTASGRVLPIIPIRGNHEGDGKVYNQIFGNPGGTSGDYWVTQLGLNVSLIALDSNSSAGGTQATWLEEQLKTAQAGRWIVPSYHRPAYPAVKTPGSAKQFWVPLFEQYNVDVVLESDGHVLKRTVPIRNDKMDPTGVVYVGEGGLGVPQRSPISAWYLKSPGMAKAAHHVQLLSFAADKMVYEARVLGGAVEDTYTFTPRRNGAVGTPATPAAPAIASAQARTSTQVAISFAADMDPLTTAVLGAFQLSPALEIRDVAMEDARTVVLTTGEMANELYTLTVTGVSTATGGAAVQPLSVTFQGTASATEPAPPTTEPMEPATPPTGTQPPAGTDPNEPGVDPLPEEPGAEDPTNAGCTAAGGAAMWAGLAAVSLVTRRRRRNRAA